jgi:hypothetical protein
VPVGPGRFPYLATSRWADPDLDHAAALMRQHVDHPAEHRARADAARSRVLRDFSPLATGTFIRDRLAVVRSEGRGSPRSAGRASTLRRLQRRITTAFEPTDT